MSVSYSEYSDSIERLYRKIHLSHLGIYSVILFSTFAIYLAISESKYEEQEIKRVEQIVTANIDDIVEEVYISEILGLKQSENLALKKVSTLLTQQNFSQKLKIGSCDSREPLTLALKIGTRDLKKCIVVSSAKTFLSQTSLISLLLVTVAFSLTLLFYVYISRNLKSKVIIPLFVRLKQAEENRIYKQVAKQVAHDIQSPITALRFLFKSDGLSEEEKALYSNSMERIEGILVDLNNKTGVRGKLLSNNSCSTIVLSRQLRFLINEKAAEVYPAKLSLKLEALQSSQLPIGSVSVNRMLSNIINNSAEAGASEIEVRIKSEDGRLIVAVQDNGPGLPEKFLLKPVEFKPDESPKGNALGLYSAQIVLDRVGGEIRLRNSGAGALVEICIPLNTLELRGLSSRGLNA